MMEYLLYLTFMTVSEKTALYEMLTLAEGSVDGYLTRRQPPTFTDDAEIPCHSVAPASGTAAEFANLSELAAAVHSCTACPLASGRSNAVSGEGPADGRPVPVMVIGEGPGADEDASGRPFVGRAGQLLDKMLSAINLSRSNNCYIANIVKCRPPQNREPAPEEAAACRHFLEAQIALVRPAAIIALGRTAAQNLLGTTEGINRLRGSWHEYRGIPVLPTYHPSALLRDETLKRPAWEDLKEFRSRLDEILNGQ